jgi:hypothetical protein
MKSPGADRGFSFDYEAFGEEGLPKVICRTQREDIRRKTGAGEVEPLLVLPVGADI